MKIEFRKVPLAEKSFANEYNSVKIEGTFCKISPRLVKLDATLKGKTAVECCRCGDEFEIDVDEPLEISVSDGEISTSELEDIVFEARGGIIDFDEITISELESIRSDYHICPKCGESDQLCEKEI
jgi:uncharacterized metal-binding protein YceD (DUF177 family)